MRLFLERSFRKDTYTIGKLYIENKYFCNTCEDKDRGLTQDMPLAELKQKKVYGETAIPRGTYKITLDVVSPKYSKSPFAMEVCGAKMPRLLDVPNWDGVLIHSGTTAKDSYGCILVGKNTIKGGVTSSKDTFRALYKELLKDKDNLYITIF